MTEMSTRGVVADVVAGMRPISLDELQLAADLQTRLDRKYIVEPTVVAGLISELAPRMCALAIGGRRDFSYASTYFDTPQFDSYRSSAGGRRRRFKVRTRSYLDSGACVLEVKTAGGRGHTVKERLSYDIDLRDALDDRAWDFLRDNRITEHVSSQLVPTLVTTYQRTTLLGDDGARCTIDSDLECLAPSGLAARLPGKVLVETKSPGAVTPLDRLLWARGIRPVSISKYCTGLAAVTPGLPANKWNSTLRRHFGWAPQPGLTGASV